MNLALRCRCGSIQGEVDPRPAVGRALCYCHSCQSYARFLGREEDVLNAQGGTDIIATQPRSLRFTAGIDQLASMSVTDKGPLRWYAQCCRTPIGNTARGPKIAYLGLVRACLAGSDAAIDEAFGPARIALNTENARGHVKSTPAATLLAAPRILAMIAGARLTGQYKNNPFFRPETQTPIAPPHALTPAERMALHTSS